MRLAHFIPMIAATVLWAWPMIAIHYIKDGTGGAFQPDALNVYRYAAGALFALAVVGCSRPADLLTVLRKPGVPLALAAILAAFQVVWVRGVYMIGPAYGTLVNRTTVLFALLLTYLVFADERRVIRSRRFLASAAAALAAVIGITVLDPGFSLAGLSSGSTLVVGTLVMLGSSVIWAVYAVAVRKLGRHLPPMATFAVTAAFTTVLLVPLGFLWADMGVMWSGLCTWKVQLAVVFSGAACVGATLVLYYVSLKRIGVAYSSLVSLGSPFLTGVFSFLVLGEVLTFWQWLLGGVLAAALGFLIHSSLQPRAEPAAAAERAGQEPEDLELEGR